MGTIVALTGANSYAAATILPLLEADPGIDKIIGIDISPWKGGYEKVVFHREDIRSERIPTLLAGVDTVFHLAFVVEDQPDKRRSHDININGSRNVFEACIRNQVRKVIYTSSMTVYGAHPHNPLGLTESAPLLENSDSHYNKDKIEVENFARNFFQNHPEVVFTVLRVGLICGPGINNMFSALWSRKIAALPMGRQSYNQFIHEKDLGRALQLAYRQDLPGVFNVAADDAMATRRAFQLAGVRIIHLPAGLLKILLQFLYWCRLERMGKGWVSLSEYTIFGTCAKFKKAGGWQPEFTSEATFLAFLEARKRHAKDTPKQAFLTWFYKTPVAAKSGLRGLNALLFALEKIPLLRNLVPLTDPRKNNMTYLPAGKAGGNGRRSIPVNTSLGQPVNAIVSRKALDDMIERASFHLLMDACICRTAFKCRHFTPVVGCLFMGETAKKFPPGLGRPATRAQAHAHVGRAVDLGLVPMLGKVNVDNLGFLTKDTGELLSVCFCCHCCCMMGYYKHDHSHLKRLFKPMEGLNVTVTEKCVGCGTCCKTCLFDNIRVANGKAVHADHCVGCGRCEANCPNRAVTLCIHDPLSVEAVKERIGSFVKIS